MRLAWRTAKLSGSRRRFREQPGITIHHFFQILPFTGDQRSSIGSPFWRWPRIRPRDPRREILVFVAGDNLISERIGCQPFFGAIAENSAPSTVRSSVRRIANVLAARLLALISLLFEVALVPLLFGFPHVNQAWGASAYNLAVAGAVWIYAFSIGDSQTQRAYSAETQFAKAS